MNNMVKFEYDKEVDAAYIYLEYPIKEGSVKKTVEGEENVILDFDVKGKLIGVEILEASKTLNAKILDKEFGMLKNLHKS